ncbi:cytidine deaminase [Mesonia sp. K7]|uniref:cytidine deaminase n=1 Tax=Mesonia sp. K7 TaxID=2218606 RepID=UPI000DA784B7|nr:cytidine deaminase [Mesonia sp. K7]PZD77160.1 cytidine deaminase [Mesonia sp. K7]
MKEEKISFSYQVYDDAKELPLEIQDLRQKAITTRDNAYAPYSNFLVGAAILLENKVVVTGSNQENAAFPSGSCAERTAIYYAGSQYPNQKIKSIFISVKSNQKSIENPTPPCGACRQAIAEYEVRQKQPIKIYFAGEKGKIMAVNSLSDLLPLAFDGSFL